MFAIRNVASQLGGRVPHLAQARLTTVNRSSFALFSSAPKNSNSQQDKYDNETLSAIVKSDKVVVFMKGVPEAPRCGFSNAVVQVLRMHAVPFQAHDVLASEPLRKAIKDFTNWPTIPQIFIDGEFIGGCDILLEKHQNGELIEDLAKVGIQSQIQKEAQEAEKSEDKKEPEKK